MNGLSHVETLGGSRLLQVLRLGFPALLPLQLRGGSRRLLLSLEQLQLLRDGERHVAGVRPAARCASPRPSWRDGQPLHVCVDAPSKLCSPPFLRFPRSRGKQVLDPGLRVYGSVLICASARRAWPTALCVAGCQGFLTQLQALRVHRSARLNGRHVGRGGEEIRREGSARALPLGRLPAPRLPQLQRRESADGGSGAAV